MKKILKKGLLSASVAVALLAGVSAQADSLLAPLVVSDQLGGYQTFISMKMRMRSSIFFWSHPALIP